jgi:hypothetical protein
MKLIKFVSVNWNDWRVGFLIRILGFLSEASNRNDICDSDDSDEVQEHKFHPEHSVAKDVAFVMSRIKL